MKATLIVIQNKADHAEAKALVATLMQSGSEADHARALAQARLVEAYEKMRGRAGARQYRTYSPI
jgi:HTH-type transcriptional regulator/antitoxin HigA